MQGGDIVEESKTQVDSSKIPKKSNTDLRVSGWIILVLVLVGVTFLLIRNSHHVNRTLFVWKLREKLHIPDSRYSPCLKNLKDIGNTLELYRTDNSGDYPDSLSRLTPGYLKTIPTCPSAGRDTYSETYRVNKKTDFVMFSCSGSNHWDSGFPPNFPRYNNLTQLTCRSGEIDDDIRFYRIRKIMEIVDKDPSIVRKRLESTNTLLHIAAFYNFEEAIILFLDNGADINAINNSGWTPLHVAAYSDHYEAIKLLLEKGANKNIKDKEGMTPLDIAKKRNFEDIFILLKEK